jgi:hypothetical protein
VTGKVPKHYHEKSDFNDKWNEGLARYSFHIEEDWEPTHECRDGTNLVDVLDMLHESMCNSARD